MKTILAASALAAALGLAPVARAEPADSFSISPRVVELAGRPGDRVPFEVEIAARATPQAVDLDVVRLAQDEEGLILPAAASPTALADVTIEGPRHVVLEANAASTVRGSVLVRGGHGSALRLYGLRATSAAEG
ncbi:MAG TPA: hypothetical protein VHF22_12510, partial [Planctomycetota bacterium]|nr:hypothetical protein [Planctomycetota bacterium]